MPEDPDQWADLRRNFDATTCGHTVIVDGIEQPCGDPVTSWRWYQDVDHEDALTPTCDEHDNLGGWLMRTLLAERDALAAKVQRFAQMLANQAVGVNDALSQAHQKIAQVEALLDLVVGEQGRSALVLASSVRAALADDGETS